MESKLGLNLELVNQARQSAAHVADDTQRFIDQHTTVTVERAVCRLLGIDGVNDMDVPLPNVVVDHMMATSFLPMGAAWAIGNAMIETGKDPQAVAEAIDKGELDLSKVPAHSDEEIRAAITPVVNATVERINKNVAKRNSYLKEWGDKEGPYLYIIVATGNIYEDIIQAKAGAKQGADIIAVIRTTGQSLLDYVPYGATTEGFGGTYATQENFRLMRAALDEVGEEQHRYIRLCNYCSGLCMPEIAAMGALERLDVMLNDALYGILFRDINMQRTIVDQYFSRVINGYAGVIINTGEDNYLTTDDAITAAHTVLASQFIENAQYIFRTMKDLGSELTYKEGGIIQTRANEVLTKATDLLAEIEKLGLFTTIEKGIFADVKRPKDGGKGLSGVVIKSAEYFNPFIELMKGKVAAE